MVFGNQQLLGSSGLEKLITSRSSNKQSSNTTLRSAAAVILTVAATFYFLWPSSTKFSDVHRRSDKQYSTYAGEHLVWESCGNATGRPLECSSINVPMDQYNASNSGSKTFHIPLIRLRGKNATQNVLLNPGGPGGSGIGMIKSMGSELNTVVGEGFHLLSFDPRGVKGSKPVASCYPDDQSRYDMRNLLDSTKVGNSANVYAWTTGYVKGCADNMGEHGKYLNTPQTAADMNSILDALGQEKMYYWGFSYGTLLGQTYATLFPNRSHRVIIDGVANQFDWYEGHLATEEFADTENVFQGFINECVKAGTAACALASIAKTQNALTNSLNAYLDVLLQNPLSVYVDKTAHGVFDYTKLMYLSIFKTMYRPASWYDLAQDLAVLMKGNATDYYLEFNGTGSSGDDPYTFITMNDGHAGPNYWKQGYKSMDAELASVRNFSRFMLTEWDNYYTMQQWSIPKTHTYKPVKGVKTAHPLLILSTTYDPVCPLISARSAQAAFVDSQIVEVKGYGHCSLAAPSVCITKYVRDFLYDGKMPANYTQCEPDGPWFIVPSADGTVKARAEFSDPEEARIHLAQLQLAKDWMQ